MLCPKCQSDNITCIDSRNRQIGTRRRRYLCRSCDHRFTTVEICAEDLAQLRDAMKKFNKIVGDYNEPF